MLGRSTLTSGVRADNRVFVYEVAGLRQNDQTDRSNHEIRHSSTMLMQVPFGRMNEFMQRINRMGAQIVSIRSSDAAQHQAPKSDDGQESKSSKKSTK